MGIRALPLQISASLALFLAIGTQTTPAGADGQDIMDASGNSFMEEEAPAPKPQRRMPTARLNIINSQGASTNSSPTQNPRRLQSIQTSGSSGNDMFMQEVDTPSSRNNKPYVDLSNVGVQVDPSGNTVPLIDHSGSPVRPLYNNTQAYQEMAVPIINQTADNPLALPYTLNGQRAPVGTTFIPVTPGTVPYLRPSYNPFNGTTSFNPYSTGGISPYYGGGAYPGGYGYSPGINLNIGNLHIGSNPYGYPGYGVLGYPGTFGLPGYGYGGYAPGGFGYGAPGFGGFGTGGLFGRSGFGFGRGLLGALGGLGGYGYGYGGYGGYPLLSGYNQSLAYSGPYGSFIGGGGILGYNSGYYANNPYYSPIWQQNPYTMGGTGVTSSQSSASLSLPVPLERNVQSSYGTSTLIAPVLRDPATSTGDLLEDAKRAGLWGNTTGQNNSRVGPLGGFSGYGTQQDQGVTNGAGFR